MAVRPTNRPGEPAMMNTRHHTRFDRDRPAARIGNPAVLTQRKTEHEPQDWAGGMTAAFVRIGQTTPTGRTGGTV